LLNVTVLREATGSNPKPAMIMLLAKAE
jgi:hypothetical protein